MFIPGSFKSRYETLCGIKSRTGLEEVSFASVKSRQEFVVRWRLRRDLNGTRVVALCFVPTPLTLCLQMKWRFAMTVVVIMAISMNTTA